MLLGILPVPDLKDLSLLRLERISSTSLRSLHLRQLSLLVELSLYESRGLEASLLGCLNSRRIYRRSHPNLVHLAFLLLQVVLAYSTCLTNTHRILRIYDRNCQICQPRTLICTRCCKSHLDTNSGRRPTCNSKSLRVLSSRPVERFFLRLASLASNILSSRNYSTRSIASFCCQ